MVYSAHYSNRAKEMALMPKYEAQEKYDRTNTQHIGLKLNKKTDADILEALNGKAKQTEIKRLIRLGLAKDK